MNRTIALVLVVLWIVACSGAAVTSTSLPSTSSTSTSLSTTSTTTIGVTSTTAPTSTTGSQTAATLPPVIARTVFAFTGGTTPFITVTTEVAETRDGPWQPAGFNADPTPILTESSFWVRFTIANRDSLGQVIDVDISGFDNSVIGEDVCTLDDPIPVGGSATCVVPDDDVGFPVEPGGAQNDFDSIGEGERQGTEIGRYFQPPIPTSLDYDGARHSFILLFDTGEGAGVEGTSDGAEIEVDVDRFDLSRPVRVDCSDRYPDGRSSTGGSPTEGEPALIAYVIENFSGSGQSQGGCSEIPMVSLPFEPIETDTAFLYETP